MRRSVNDLKKRERYDKAVLEIKLDEEKGKNMIRALRVKTEEKTKEKKILTTIRKKQRNAK